METLRGSHMQGSRHDIIGTLSHINVIIRVYWDLAAYFAAGKFDCPVGDYFIGIHIGGGGTAGLEDVDGEVPVELAADYF